NCEQPMPTIVIHEAVVQIEDQRLPPGVGKLELKAANLSLINDPLDLVAIDGIAGGPARQGGPARNLATQGERDRRRDQDCRHAAQRGAARSRSLSLSERALAGALPGRPGRSAGRPGLSPPERSVVQL